MADIDIVPKHRSYLWLWILLALIIVAALWYALTRDDSPARVGALLGHSPVALAQAAAGAWQG